MALERLQKIIARAGISSRREAEEYIRDGRVTVNGQVVTELGTRADPLKDHVKVDGKLVQQAEDHRYILMYKPREVMTTTVDPEGRPTVLDLLRGVRERVFPVGRLDYHSEGLLLLTNDGDLAFRVSHPSSGSVKTYHVKVRGVPPHAVIDKLARGVVLDGKRTLPCEIRPLRTTGRTDDEGNSWWEVRLREGRTNQIRRMFQYQGHPVSKLRRVGIGALTDPKLGPGDWRELTDREISRMLAEPAEPRATRARKTMPGGARRTTAGKPGSRSASGRPAKRSSSDSRSAKAPAGSRGAKGSSRSGSTSGAEDRRREGRRGGSATPGKSESPRASRSTQLDRPRAKRSTGRTSERPDSGRVSRKPATSSSSRPRGRGSSTKGPRGGGRGNRR